MDGYSFTYIVPIVGSIIGIVSCAACMYRFRKHREQLQNVNQFVISPLTEQITRQPNVQPQIVSYPVVPHGVTYAQHQQQQPYVMGYSQPLTPVGYYSYPQPSAPMGPVQGPYSV
jgi:hypothetical protein